MIPLKTGAFSLLGPPLIAFTCAALAFAGTLASHAGTLAKLTIQPEKGEKVSLLSFESIPGHTYRIQKSTGLNNGGGGGGGAGGNINWLFGEMRMASSNTTQVEIPWTATTEFYRLVGIPEIVSVEPMWVDASDPASLLYIVGQFLPTNATVVINGQNFVPTVINTGGVWAHVSLNGLPHGELTGLLSVIDNDTGATAATYKLQSGFIYATSLGSSLRLAPPENPPASPVTQVDLTGRASHEGLKLQPGGGGGGGAVGLALAVADNQKGEVCDDGNVNDGDGVMMKVKEKGNRTKCGNNLRIVSPSTGELVVEETDLFIEGRGLDFAWVRTYRSRAGTNTALGYEWDFNYNVRLSQKPNGTVVVSMGNGRHETFSPTGTNTWVCDGYFMQIGDLDGDGMPDALFADTSKWFFRPEDAADAAGGKLSRIVDRNGNTLSLNYDSSGHLSSIIDTLGRTITVTVDPGTGRIISVTDFTGRVVRYEYDTNGDLAACVLPEITGTPHGNDFPGGITNRYLYTSGFSDSRLNHNLTACITGKGDIALRVNYDTATDASSADFDTVASVQRGVEKKDIRRGMVKPTPGNRFAVTQVFVNDYVGNVTEYFFDSRNRCVCRRDYTGRANPLLPTTAAENRPKGKLRDSDPEYYETRWTWNADSLCTSVTEPSGLRTLFVYERDFNPACSPRHKGNLRVLREIACCADADSDGDGLGDYTERSWRYDYDPRFGSDPMSLDGIVPGIAQHAINTKGTGAAGKLVAPSLNHAINTKGTGAAGRIVPTTAGHAINTKGTGAAGRVLPTVNKKHAINTKGTGAAGRIIVNDIKKGSGMAAREKDKPFLMPVEDYCPAGFVVSEIDPLGNIATAHYDDRGNCSVINPRASRDNFLQGAADVLQAIRFAHNTNGQLVAVTNAADANGYRRVDTLTYYTNGVANGKVQHSQRDSNGNACVYSFEYDERGNVTRVVDPNTNDWLFAYNALDLCISSQSPVNVTSRTLVYRYCDQNQNVSKCTRLRMDQADKPIGTFSEIFSYDYLDRLVELAEQVSETHFVTNRFAYNGNDLLVAVYSPMAVSGADVHNMVTFSYDERDLLYQVTASPGSADQTTDQCDYTVNGRLAAVITGIEGGGTSVVYEYDSFDRRARLKDALGNTSTGGYDKNDRLIRLVVEAETNDVPGSAGNVRYHEWTWAYNPRGQCVRSAVSLFDPASQAPFAGGSAITTFTYAPNGRLSTVSDPRRQITAYTYDFADRIASITSPKTNVVSFTYDKCDNVIAVTKTDRADVGGTTQTYVVTSGYDKLHRLTRTVDNTGNTNEYAYDSDGNLVSHIDPNGVMITRHFDGIGQELRMLFDSNKDGQINAGEIWSGTSWNDNGLVTSMTDANTNLTVYSYDSRNRCVSVSEADGTVCSLVWSPRSNLLRQEDPNGTVISNSFDGLDRCVRRDIVPGSGVATTTTFEMFAYDGLGRIVLASNDVSCVRMSYDSLGNVTRCSEGGFDVVLVYDQNGNRTSMTYPNGGVVNYTYDPQDQLASISGSPLLGTASTMLATFAYEGDGRIGRISRANNVNTRITWNGALNPPNVSGDFGWRQVSGINHQVAGGGAVIDRRAYSYDRNQNKTVRAQSVPFVSGGEMTTNVFGYDDLNRVYMAIKSKGTGAQRVNYSLDGKGNRQTVTTIDDTGVPAVQTYTMSSSLPEPADFQMDQYTTTPNGSQQYDRNGNVIWKDLGDLAFVCDFDNRLVAVQSMTTGTPETVVSFAYDTFGRRISKTTFPGAGLPPIVSQYVYDPPPSRDCDDNDDRLLEERVNGTVHQVFCWGSNTRCIGDLDRDGALDLVAAFTGTGEARFYHADELGNVLALTDASGNVIERYDYDDYGLPQFLDANGNVLPVSFSQAGNPFLFHGMFWDEEIDLYFSRDGTPLREWTFEKGWPCRYEGPRFYDASTGRYIMRAGVPLRFDAPTGFRGNNPWTLKKEEGGRHTPFHNKYRPQFYSREGGRTVGAGTVSDIIERKLLETFFERGDKPDAPQFRKILDYGEAGDNLTSHFLEVTVGSATLSPRQRVCSCPAGYW